MRQNVRQLARILSISGGAVAYALLAHLSNTTSGHKILDILLAAGPGWLLMMALAWKSSNRIAALLVLLLVTFLGLANWRALAANVSWLYFAQQTGIYVLLGVAFGRTLTGGRVPLCARFAARVHGPLSRAVADYARQVTAAWTVFFFLIAITFVTLFAVAPRSVWSAFANFCTPLLLALMFFVENRVRRRALPELEHVGIIATIRAISMPAGFDAS